MATTKINVAQGGTDASTAAAARTNLDVPQNPVIIASGGTGLTAVGTANQVLATNAGATAIEWQDANGITYAFGSFSKDLSDATGTQNVAHGLGGTPSIVKATAMYKAQSSSTAGSMSIGISNGTSNVIVYSDLRYGSNVTAYLIFLSSATSSDVCQEATATLNATNIVLSWVKNGSPIGTAGVLWEAWL